MAVSLSASDLIYPYGQLQERLFPDGDISTAVGVWLLDAAAAVADLAVADQDDAARYYVYWKAYESVTQRIASTPSTEKSFDDRTTTWSSWQLQQFEQLADYYRGEYERMVEAASASSSPAISGHAVNTVTW